MKTVLYFGIFNPEFSRNKVYIDGLRQRGVEVLVCTDTAPGLRKYWNLFRKHWALHNAYDVLIVGYPGYIIVPFAKIITRKKVVFDALCSFYETEILSRDALHEIPFRVTYTRLIDWFATRCADTVLVETDKQREYFISELGVPAHKCVTVYTGVDDTVFYTTQGVQKHARFTVLFRGRITHEAGVATVVRAAKLLEGEGIDVLIIGYGWNREIEHFNAVVAELAPTNMRHIAKQLPFEELRTLMQQCHVSLGQFAAHERLTRTIPHKAFESLAMKLPYITARAEGVCEILEDEVNCMLVHPDDPVDLARAIRTLAADPALRERLAYAGHQLYQERFCPKKVVAPISNLLETRV
jgi:glycosyltransferase involved in cell wall biosynthesis